MTFPLSPTAPHPAQSHAAGRNTADPVKDVGLSTFMADVIDASKMHIVVVDFWAPWCGPCKQLGPTIEKVVRSYNGAVTLAKIDIDQNQQIAQQMQIQSIPAVFAFFQGQPIDGFMGALPEAQIKSWLDRLIKSTGATGVPAGEPDLAADLASAMKQAEEYFASGDVTTAQAVYADVLDQDPKHAGAYAGLMRCLIALGDTAEAKRMLETAPPEMAKDKSFDPIRTTLELAEQAGKTGASADLATKVAGNPADHQARYDLALAYYAEGKREQAVDELLEIVRRSRSWNEDAARKQLVKFFEAFGPTDPLTIASRKRLSSILFS
jgi:putative thioredoxin